MGDPEVNVLAVGDGACSVLRPWPENRPGPVVVLDCGVRRGKPTDAAQTLLDRLCGSLGDVEAIVVSHFDWDHWGGLANLRNVASPPNDLAAISLYYPAMPPRVTAAFMAMMGPLAGTGSAALDLQIALTALSPTSTPPTLRPLNNRSAPVLLAGDRFHVLWPPSQIGPNQLRAINNAVAAVDSLANDLANAGRPELRENLSRANQTAQESQEPNNQRDLPAQERSNAQQDYTAWENGPDTEQDDWVPNEAPLLDTIPEEWHERYKRVLNKIRSANNDLSLVLAAESGRLIAFGDIGGSALTTLLQILHGRANRTLPDKYDVLLVPHHGSHIYRPGMPYATWCVAQSGRDHYPKWQTNHPGAKPGGPSDASHRHAYKCWNTHLHGSFPHR